MSKGYYRTSGMGEEIWESCTEDRGSASIPGHCALKPLDSGFTHLHSIDTNAETRS